MQKCFQFSLSLSGGICKTNQTYPFWQLKALCIHSPGVNDLGTLKSERSFSICLGLRCIQNRNHHWRPPSVSIPILHYGNIEKGNSDSHHHHGPHLWTRLCWADARLLDGHLSAIPSWGVGSRLLTTWIENNIFIFIFHTNFSLFLLTINKHVVCSHLCCIGPEARDAVGHISVNPEIFYILSFFL